MPTHWDRGGEPTFPGPHVGPWGEAERRTTRRPAGLALSGPNPTATSAGVGKGFVLPAGLFRVRAIRAAIVAFLAAAIVVPATGATAEATTTTHTRMTQSVVQEVLTIAARQYGKPYRWGSSGPNSFDCSGFTSYVFRQVGISLPHSSGAQYGVVTHIPQSQKRPGDLIFVYSGGRIGHVAIYAGNNEMWAATHTGDIVRKERLYTSDYRVGRA